MGSSYSSAQKIEDLKAFRKQKQFLTHVQANFAHTS